MKAFPWLALVLLMPGLGLAQTDGQAPLIILDPMPTTTEVVPPPVNPAPTPVAPQVSPLIELAPAETAVAVEPAQTAPAQGTPAQTAPPQGTAAQGTPAQGTPAQGTAAETVADLPPVVPEDWLLPLVPAMQPVPTEVRVGSSMPQPNEFRLTGETARAEFLLTLPAGVSLPKDLLLSLRSSVNVLAKSSRLTVQINDVEAGVIDLSNIGPFAEQTIPATGLTPGVNRIILTVAQAHRIYCGPEASFAIWTEVKLGSSGVRIDPGQVPLNPEGFLAAVQSQIARSGPVEILVDPKTDTAKVRDVASRISDTLGELPLIEVSPFYATEGDPEARARIALISSPTPRVLFRRGAGGAVVMQVEFADSLPTALDQLLPVPDSNWGIAALTPGRKTTLAELGQAGITANTHYYRKDIDFLLPQDWLLLASQKANFTLHYGFSGDLAKGALMLVKVNGQTVRLLPLDQDGGEILPPLDISFRANLLNPGVNTLTLEMSVPGDPPDLPCTPRRTDMLVVLDDSSIDVPPSPRMRQMDMSRRLARLGGDDVVIPEEVADPTRDATTLLAFSTRLRPLVMDEIQAKLNVVGLDAVGLVPTGDTGVTRRMLQKAVYPDVERPIAAEPTPTAATEAPTFSLANADGVETVAAPRTVDSGWSPWQAVVRFFSADGWIYRQIGGVRDLALPNRITLTDWLEGKSGQAMLLQLDPDAPDSIWLIAGPEISMTDLALRVDEFRRRGRSDVHGQAALLQSDGRWVTWSSRRRPELLEPLTIWNMRSVLGNYASWSPSIFTALTLSLTLLSLIPALLFVVMTRRSGSRT